ncbi:MAG: erythromycin esterase family protein, partial [Cytophagaceae bacterium]|nr:erythromycin esterase family protein [Gemmatimonadaceae bacterium]
VDGRPLTALPPDAPAVTPAQRRRLEARSAPVLTVDPSDVREAPDLLLVDRIIGDARVVGLGESTHGTSEFFRTKHRLLRHLVERRGFTLFAIEANQLAVERINAWVVGGPGSARDVIRTMFRVWNTEEMLALLEWLRSHNETSRAPVRFVGYDMQDHILPRDSLVAFLRRAEPSLVADVERLTSAYRAQASFATPQVEEPVRVGWLRAADSVQQLVAARRGAWLAAARTTADTLSAEWAVQDARLFAQAARLNASLNSPDRDSLMAANLDWALRTLYPRDRAVVWAHDVHVSRGGNKTRSFNGGAQMGAHLARSYGHDYRAFSFLTARGNFSGTRSLANHEIISARAFPAPAGSVESLLGSLRRPPAAVGLVVDLRTVDARDAWLHVLRPLRHIGYASYDYGFDLEADMPLEFDGVVFIESTTASRMLPPRPRTP